MAGTRATPSASMRQRIRLGVGVGTLVCAAVLAWAGSLTDAHAEDAAHAVHSVNPVSYTHLTLPTSAVACRSRWSPYH